MLPGYVPLMDFLSLLIGQSPHIYIRRRNELLARIVSVTK